MGFPGAIGLVARRAGLSALAVLAFIFAAAPGGAAAAGVLHWHAPRLVDTAAPYADPAALNQVSCPSASLCVGADALGGIATTTSPQSGGRWKLTAPLAQNVTFYSVSCPSTTFCVAINQAAGVGEQARIAVSTDPTGPAARWKVTDGRFGSLQNVDCPTTHLCVIDTLGGLYVSTDPGAATPSWKQALPQTAASDNLLDQVSCAPASLCVTVGIGGGVFSSTDPAAGASSWKQVASFPKLDFDDISCPTAQLCVAIDENGEVVSSTNPAASHPIWTDQGPVSFPNFGSPHGLSCTAVAVCVSVDDNGDIAATGDPTGPAKGWTISPLVDRNGFISLTCAQGFCVAPDSIGQVATTSTPTAAAPGWHVSAQVGGNNVLSGISCPTVSMCVATDSGGRIVSSRTPRSTGAAWRVANADPGAQFSSVSCPTVHFCAAIGAADGLATSSAPTGGAGAWAPVHLKLTYTDDDGETQPEDFTSISCASAHQCAAGEAWYGVGYSNDPAGGAKRWSLLSVGEYDYDEFFSVSCPAVSRCVGGGLEGDVWTQPGGVHAVFHGNTIGSVSCSSVRFCVATSGRDVLVTTRPAGPWRASRVDSAQLTAVSCASASLCAAIDSAGRVLVSTDPGGGSAAWRATLVDPRYALDAISCVSGSLCVAVDSGGETITGTR